jgi:prevent-host-death family protein
MRATDTMRATYNMHEAKTHLSRLAERAANGEEIVIARNGQPLARLMPMPERKQRRLGFAKGLITIGEDFDDPLPPDIQRYCEGESD